MRTIRRRAPLHGRLRNRHAATCPFAAGLALASQYRDEDTVTVCMFGDGASNTGNSARSSNLAAPGKLPVPFLVENNLYGMG